MTVNTPLLGLADPFSCISHFMGALLCVPASIALLRADVPTRGARVAIAIFCFASFFLLTMSGVFHLLPQGSEARAVLQRLDHAAIFVLIASTFTPVHMVMFRGFWRWAPLVVIWTAAIVGIILKTVFFTQISEIVSTSVYLGMGWFGLVTGVLLYLQRGLAFIEPLLTGALFYSTGAVIDISRTPVVLSGIIGPHELFHVAVLFGIAYHWRFIKRVVAQPERKQVLCV